ncbi:MAG TPA: hypothetical protein PKW71_08065, partial [Anaerohalosphaeraceae bacterium]|nr:hypothetical protein [Anaerohalosphaeraceae bacterium]
MKHHLSAVILVLTAVLTVSSVANPLRVDINCDSRQDMRTEGWENWCPAGGDMKRSFGNLTVSLRAPSGSIELSGNKSLVVNGITVGADGAVAAGVKPAVMELQIEGLAAGPHTFVGYHHAFQNAAGIYSVSIGDRKAGGI